MGRVFETHKELVGLEDSPHPTARTVPHDGFGPETGKLLWDEDASTMARRFVDRQEKEVLAH